ncbi:hypothetical protein AYO44_04370 [Planctomycetaceae bacterium SCGC AG-212-F19]|nr:hypothetical protein AYO44_04370 [Planctomycetaceae bacterium SCGC AG-212-F19]
MIRHHHAVPEWPARVIILGGSGFVGRSLTDFLSQRGVHTLSLSSTELNLMAPAAAEHLRRLIAPDDVVVIASAITPDKGKDITALIRNLVMAENLSSALAAAPCSQVIYLSSDAVYPDDAALVSEDTACAPKSLYGLMHLAREEALSAAVAAHKVPLLILRLSIIYGVGDTHNSYGPNRFIRSALAQRRIDLFGEGEEKRDHIWIHDVCRLIGDALSRRSEGLVNVATGGSWSFRDIAGWVAESVGGAVTLHCRARQVPVTHKHFDISNTIRAFPDFHFAPLRTGLGRTIAVWPRQAKDEGAAA